MPPGIDLSYLAHEVDVSVTPTPGLSKFTALKNPHSNGTTVLSPDLITTDFDALRFEAAALEQLNLSSSGSTTPDHDIEGQALTASTSTLLISSPYNNPGHYLDLLTLDIPSLLFAKALTALKPTRPDYATAAYTDSLSFDTVLWHLRQFCEEENFQWQKTTFYVVVFRSRLKDAIDYERLYALDFESHREACESGGLLKYWFGRGDSERRNLATCLWTSKEAAHLGGLGPWHKQARAAARQMYESIVFSTHRFTIMDGAERFEFEDWD